MSVSQEALEAQIEANMPMAAIGDGDLIRRIAQAIPDVVDAAKKVIESLGGTISDATLNTLIAAAKAVLSKLLTSWGVPAPLVTAALMMLEALIEFARNGS